MIHIHECDLDILEKAQKITCTNYLEEVNWFNKSQELDGFIDPDVLISAIEDLICEVGRLEEKIEDREQDIRDNYRQITDSEMYGGIN